MRRAAILCPVAIVCLAGPARAQEDPKVAAAKRMQEGAQLMEQGQPGEALRLFRQAFRLFPNPRWQYNIGVACQAIGREAEALEAFESFLANAQGVGREYTDDARKQVENLRGRVATVTVAAKQEGAEVLVDGRDVGRTPLPRPLLLDQGERRFIVRKEKFESFERLVSLRPGEAATVEVDLKPVRALPGVPPPPPVVRVEMPPPPPPEPESAPLHRRWWFWTAVGAVVVTGVVVAISVSGGSGGPACTGGESRCLRK